MAAPIIIIREKPNGDVKKEEDKKGDREAAENERRASGWIVRVFLEGQDTDNDSPVGEVHCDTDFTLDQRKKWKVDHTKNHPRGHIKVGRENPE